jgi:primosomal protein N'
MPTLLYKSFCSIQTIQLIHWMVYEWYTTYKNVVKLFFDQEIDSLLWKEIKPKKGKVYHSCKIWNQIITWEKYQTLIIFPDIRTFLNIFPENKFEGTFLYSLDSQAKKNKNRWNIKTGNENLIATTSSEIFQDYNNLKKIYFIEPQKWYYAAQQDPRYKVDMVINKLAELYQAEFLTISSENLFN